MIDQSTNRVLESELLSFDRGLSILLFLIIVYRKLYYLMRGKGIFTRQNIKRG